MSAHDTDPSGEDLSARARRGLLSESEEAAFERQLEHDPTLRLAHRVGLDMDACTAVRVGDEALIARAADAALARIATSGLARTESNAGQRTPRDVATKPSAGTTANARKRRRHVAVLALAALVSSAGVAAGMWAGAVPVRWFTPKDERPAAPPARTATPSFVPPPIATPKAPPTQSTADIPEPEPAVASVSRAHGPGATETAPGKVGPGGSERRPETARTLFKNANAARHDGRFALARRLYSELIDRFPDSDEAALSRVSLGKLLLATGDPSDAEREFGGYLEHTHGQLAEEALVSRAESFQQMGRTKAERLMWQTLLAQYPASVYAAEARRRLEALARETEAPAR